MDAQKTWLQSVSLVLLLVPTAVSAEPAPPLSDGMIRHTLVKESVKRTGGSTSHRDVDYGPFMADITRHIKIAWSPVQGLEKKRVVVLFNIDKDGVLVNEQIGESSGDKEADACALSAVRKAAPFRKLPEGSQGEVRIKYTFGLDVYQGSLSGATLISPM